MKTKTLMIAIYIFLIGTVQVFSATLEELERNIGKSDDARIIDTDISREKYLNEKTRAESGLKLFGNAGYSWIREPESLTTDEMIYYEKLFGRLGVSFPILGSKWQEEAGILKGERNILEKQHDVEIYKKTARAVLRKEYIEFWNAHRKIELAEAFLKDEPRIKSALKERIKPGFLLDADFQEFMTPFGRARREISSNKMIKEKASGRIRYITGIKLENSEKNEPSLPKPETDESIMEKEICSFNPELMILEEIVSKNDEISKKTQWSALESNVDLAYAPSKDFPGEIGQGASVSLNLKAPLEFQAANNAATKAADLEQRKSLLYFNKRKAQTMDEFREFKAAYKVSLENLEFADQRLAAASEWIREAKLRLHNMPGDVIEKYLQARYNFLGVALDAIEAEANCFKSCADLLMNAEKTHDGSETRDVTLAKLPGRDKRNKMMLSDIFCPFNTGKELSDVFDDSCVSANDSSIGVYLWESEQLLNNPAANSFWDFIKNEKIGRILVSLNMNQISDLSKARGASNLTSFIANAKKRGISPELLLGEPSWILPDKRQNLIEIIKKLENFDFNAINLDLEPDQLGPLSDKDRKKMTVYLLETVLEVSESSKMKISLTIHPRYFDESVTGICFGCELEKIKINEAVLMIYSSDIKKVSEKAKKIIRAYPSLKFSIAQSVEKEIPYSESHSEKSRRALHEDMKKLYDSIGTVNFNSIIIQSFKHLKEMKR